MRLTRILTLVLLLTTAPAWATTYYVATTGSDSNNGTDVTTPFLTIQKGIDTVTAAGDIITVADGTYTVSGGTRYIGRVISPRPNGAIGSPITLKSTNLNGAHLILPAHVDGNFGIETWKSYWVIEGFDIAGGGVDAGEGNAGITVQGGTGNVIRKNTIHGIAAGICSFTTDGNSGVFVSGFATSTTIETNTIHTIGRLRTGEGGCAQGRNNNDHGIYVEGGSGGVTISRNLFYADNRGWPIHIYKSGGSGGNYHIYHNTFANKSPDGAGGPAGHIIIQVSPLTNVNIKNNISSDVYIGMLQCNNVTVATNVSVSFNLTDNTAIKTLPCTANIVFASNTLSTSPGFVNAGANDYTLASGSAVINAGTPISGMAYNGSNPDIGVFETFNCNASQTVNENFLDSTCGMNLNTPVLPASGATGITALLAAVARTTTDISRLAVQSSVLRTTFNGVVCVGGGTWTTTYVPGNITDSALIGGTLNQKALGYTAQAVTNNCGTAPPAEPGTPLIIYNLDDVLGTTADNTGSSGAADDGTWSGTFVRTTGKNSFGVQLTNLTAGSLAIPHGNTLDPSASSMTVAFWVNVPAALTSATRTYFGHAGVASNRFYISTLGSTWRIGIQGSNDSTASNLAVVEGWNRVCMSSSSTTDIATLWINGTVGLAPGAAKAVTTYTFPSDLTLGSPFGAGDNPGVIYDDFKWWNTAESCAADWAAEEPPSPPSGITLAQVAHQFHLLRQTAGGLVEDYRAQSATVNVVAGGAVMLTTQTDATVAGGSVAERLRYNINGSATFTEVPDQFTADGVAFYGSSAAGDADILKGSVTTLLTGALTKIDGDTHWTADAVPVVPFTTNSSTPQRSILRFASDITPETTICFKRYTQQGQAFSSYNPAAGACVVVVPVAAGSGF